MREVSNIPEPDGLERFGTQDTDLQTCPKCGKSISVNARICVCGFWFVKPGTLQTTSSLKPEVKREKRREKIRKLSYLGGVAMVLGSVVAYWAGFTTFSDNTAVERDAVGFVDAANTAVKNRNPKNVVEGTVAAVIDGETITLIDNTNKEHTIRLSGIDAPEVHSNLGQQAKENLSNLILNKPVKVVLHKIGENGNGAGKILIGDRNINFEQIAAGFAWHHKLGDIVQSEDDLNLYAEAEVSAKKSGVGLWSGANPVNPPSFAGSRYGDRSFGTQAQTENVQLVELPQQVPENQAAVAQNPNPQKDSAEQTSGPVTQSANAGNSPPVVSASPKTVVAQQRPTNASTSVTARCADGTVITRSTRSGSCSGRGGVAEWLTSGTPTPPKTAVRNGVTYTVGPRGGCYYIGSSGSKVYVDKGLCS